MYGSFAEKSPRCLVGTANFGDMGGSDFDVFISYARAVSTPLAVDLQRELERFAKRWNQVRALRVFRDDSSMSASPSLWSSIEAALTTSKYLILIATPEAAASPISIRRSVGGCSRMGVTVGSTESLRIIPVRPTAADLWAKLASNMSRKQWNEWIPPDLDYQKACPELPIASDD